LAETAELSTGHNLGSTYYISAEGCFTDCSLRVEMVHPDSINEIHIENIPDGPKKKIYSRNQNSRNKSTKRKIFYQILNFMTAGTYS